MISDVLSDAIMNIKDYLSGPIFNDVYVEQLRQDILTLIGEMDAMRSRLDMLPTDDDAIADEWDATAQSTSSHIDPHDLA